MKVLHLTDLHVTEEHATLRTLWLGPSQVIGDQRFDAIIVSGDLTQRASPPEYSDLRQFAQERLMLLLPEDKREAGRIIFVPGNHDVDWSVRVGTRLNPPWRFWGNREVEQEWEKYRSNPASSPLRLDFQGNQRVRLLRVDIDSEQYRQRYRSCQAFLDGFYSQSSTNTKALVKPFKLTQVGEDWSVHQFVEEKVAIFGFNSCHGNDRYWTAAHIDHRSIENAASYWKERFPNYQAVAVWHHGLAAEQGRPDFLTFNDVARLQEAGFQVGFHGHIHAANNWTLTQLRDDFLLIATGSLAAGREDLMQGTGQQFSIVELHRSRVTVDVYERRGLGAQYVLNRDASRRFYLGAVSSNHVPTRSERHVRTWSVDPNGILEGTVELSGLQVEDSLVLAQLQPPFCNFEYHPVDADGQRLKVDVSPRPDGHQRLVLAESKGEYPKLSWRYMVSNAVALNQGDLKLREVIQRWHPNVPPSFDVRSHVVRHDTDELVLRLEFEKVVREEGDSEEPQPAIEQALAIVEERLGDDEWKIAQEEQKRCKVTLLDGCEDRCAELRVTAPAVGLRYGIMFRPKVKGPNYPSQARHLADYLLQQCRKQKHPSEIRQELTDSIRINVVNELLTPEASAELLDSSSLLLGQEGIWIGFIWDEEIRRLLAAFGEFPPENWASRFVAGSGLAGHAFRQSGTAFWWKNEGRGRLLFQTHVEPNERSTLVHPTEVYGNQPPRYDWLVCVPLYFSPKGRSIGVVSFAGKARPDTPMANTLENLAYRFAHLSPKMKDELAPEEWEAHLKDKQELFLVRAKLENAVNFGFWQIIASAPEIEDADKSVAREFFRSVKSKLKKQARKP